MGAATDPPPQQRVGAGLGPAGRGLTRSLLGLWIFHRLLGGGGAFNPAFAGGRKLRVAVTNWMDHLLTKFQKYRTENFVAINVLVTSLHAILDPEVAIVCKSIKGKLLNRNAYKTQVRRKMTSSTRWLSRIFDISWFWPKKFQKHLFCFWMNKNDHKIKNFENFQKTVFIC